MSEFIVITEDGDLITSKMPADETVVEVKLQSGRIIQAWYSCNIAEAGDYDFLPAKDGEPDMDAESIADQVVAWRAVNQ